MDSFTFLPAIDCKIKLDQNKQQQQQLQLYAIQKQKINYSPQLWTNANQPNSNIWTHLAFKPLTQKTNNNNTTIWHLNLKLTQQQQQQPINYRFTYRLASNTNPNDVIWLGLQGQDGQIQFTQELVEPISLKDLILKSCAQQSNQQQLIQKFNSIDYHLFTLKTEINSTITNLHEHPIHLPHQVCNSLDFDGLAFVRSKPTWFNPQPFTRLSEISSSFDTQLIIIHDPKELDQKNLLILIPISSNSSSSSIRSTQHSPLTICTTTITTTTTQPPIIKLMIINAPQSKLHHIIHNHSLLLNHPYYPDQNHLEKDHIVRLTSHKKLGYCTWDSLGPDYKLSDVLKVLKSFEKSKILNSIDRVLLDDGWQHVNGRLLSGWGPRHDWMDLGGLENGDSNLTNTCTRAQGSDLARAISLIRSNQSIKFVGVWVTITGYWCGLDPQSEIMKPYQLQSWSVRPSDPQSSSNPADPLHWSLPKKNCIRPFWDTYFKFLKSAGVQFIKIDNQAGLDRLVKCESDPSENVQVYKTTLIDIVDDLSRQYFGRAEEGEEENTIIHCMAHSPQIWFRDHDGTVDSSSHQTKLKNKHVSDLNAKSRVTKVMRTSDDFFPDLMDFSGHQWHILSNSFNSMLANGLGFVPDFDMTMTKHKYSDYHAAFRVFTNAQIYITDRNGEHDVSTCQKLTAPLKWKGGSSDVGVVQSLDGAGFVLSSNSLGQSAKDISLADSPWGLLKVGLPATYAGGGLIGIWNVKQGSKVVPMASDVITARDIAETILSNQPRDDGNSDGHELKNFVIFCDDNNYQKGNGRYEVIEDFDSNLELDLAKIASRPIVGTTLAGQDPQNQNLYEIWRISRLFDLPVDSKEEITWIQVASLGLLNQFAGLCAVITRTPTNKFSIQKPHSEESLPATQVMNAQPMNSHQAAQIQEPLVTNGRSTRPESERPTSETQHREQRGGGLISWLNMIGLCGRNNQRRREDLSLKKFCRDFSRDPIQTIKFVLGDVIKFMILLTLKSFKSIIFFFIRPSSSTTRPSSDDESGEIGEQVSTPSTDASRPAHPMITERTPLLLRDEHNIGRNETDEVMPTPPSHHQTPPSVSLSSSSSSSVKVDTSIQQDVGVEFQTLFTDKVGFMIRIKFADTRLNQSDEEEGSKNLTVLIELIKRSIQVRINGHDFALMDYHECIQIHVLNTCNLCVELFCIIHLELLLPRFLDFHLHSHLWSISFHVFH